MTSCLCHAKLLQSCQTLCDPMDCSLPGSSVHGDSPDKNSGVGCHALLQGSSRPRDQTQVSWIAGRFFTNWATREAQGLWKPIDAGKDCRDQVQKAVEILLRVALKVSQSPSVWARYSSALHPEDKMAAGPTLAYVVNAGERPHYRRI